MPRYRIHRIKETPRENFRWAPHTGGLTVVKPKDYDCNREVEAATPYAAWKALEQEGKCLHPGDLLEVTSLEGSLGELLIAKYTGFELAQWQIPELRRETISSATEFTPAPPASQSSEQQS